METVIGDCEWAKHSRKSGRRHPRNHCIASHEIDCEYQIGQSEINSNSFCGIWLNEGPAFEF